MPRSGEEARRRLQQAALELFSERGYDQTTAAGIAARAGVTERTFFRHFPDKREVLFTGESPLLKVLTSAIADAPPALNPLEVLYRAFRSTEQMLEDNRPFSYPRHRVIAASPALQERELAKAAALTQALAEALQKRGVDGHLARLAAQTGMATFSYAIGSWFADPSRRLGAHLDRALDELRGLSAATATTIGRSPRK